MQVPKDFSAPSSAPAAASRPSFLARHKVLVGVLLVFAALVLLVLAAMAKTGVIRIPIVSNLVSTTSEPVRTVVIPPGTPSLAAARTLQLESAINRYLRSRSDEDRQFELRLTEATLTKAIQESASDLEATFPGVKFISGQLAIDDVVEFFLQIKRSGQLQTLRVRAAFSVENGLPKIHLEEVRLGSLPIPKFLANILVDRALQDNIRNFVQQNAVLINDIELRKGLAVIKALLPTNVTNLK